MHRRIHTYARTYAHRSNWMKVKDGGTVPDPHRYNPKDTLVTSKAKAMTMGMVGIHGVCVDTYERRHKRVSETVEVLSWLVDMPPLYTLIDGFLFNTTTNLHQRQLLSCPGCQRSRAQEVYIGQALAAQLDQQQSWTNVHPVVQGCDAPKTAQF